MFKKFCYYYLLKKKKVRVGTMLVSVSRKKCRSWASLARIVEYVQGVETHVWWGCFLPPLYPSP